MKRPFYFKSFTCIYCSAVNIQCFRFGRSESKISDKFSFNLILDKVIERNVEKYTKYTHTTRQILPK